MADLLAELMRKTHKTPQQLLRDLIAKYRAEGKIKGEGKTGSTEFARLVGITERYLYEMLNEEDNRFGIRRQRDMERRCGLPEGWFADGGEIAEQVRDAKKRLWQEFEATRLHAILSDSPEKLRLLRSIYDSMPMSEPPYPTVPMLEGFAGVLLGKLQTSDELWPAVALNERASEGPRKGAPRSQPRRARKKKPS